MQQAVKICCESCPAVLQSTWYSYAIIWSRDFCSSLSEPCSASSWNMLIFTSTLTKLKSFPDYLCVSDKRQKQTEPLRIPNISSFKSNYFMLYFKHSSLYPSFPFSKILEFLLLQCVRGYNLTSVHKTSWVSCLSGENTWMCIQRKQNLRPK